MRRILHALFLLSALASVARADSDGYFCIGPNYIAYQFCGKDTLRVASHDTVYSIALDSMPRLVATQWIPVAERRFPSDSFAQESLGISSHKNHYEGPERRLIGKTAEGRTFALVITTTYSRPPRLRPRLGARRALELRQGGRKARRLPRQENAGVRLNAILV